MDHKSPHQFLQDTLGNIQNKFGSNWSSSVREDFFKVMTKIAKKIVNLETLKSLNCSPEIWTKNITVAQIWSFII